MADLTAQCLTQSASLLKCHADHQAALACARGEHAVEVDRLRADWSAALSTERDRARAEVEERNSREAARLMEEQREELQVSLASLHVSDMTDIPPCK